MTKREKIRYFSIKSYVVDVNFNRLTEAILIHIQNMILWRTHDNLGKTTGLFLNFMSTETYT